MTDDARPFVVRSRHLDRYQGRRVVETTFEAAAIAYLEDVHPAADEGQSVGVIVRDVESGHEHCFWIDLETGRATSCD